MKIRRFFYRPAPATVTVVSPKVKLIQAFSGTQPPIILMVNTRRPIAITAHSGLHHRSVTCQRKKKLENTNLKQIEQTAQSQIERLLRFLSSLLIGSDGGRPHMQGAADHHDA
jgi:hypothetical protein